MTLPTGPLWGRPSRKTTPQRTKGGGTPGYVPPGWPERVHPPGVPDWEQTARSFLLDCCPPDVRLHPVLARYPVMLARFAAESVDAQLTACAAGIRECRVSLREHIPGDAVEEAALAWCALEATLRRTRREVSLVEEALRGAVFIRKL